MSNYTFKRLDEDGRPYAVRHKDRPDGDALGFVWQEPGSSRWEAIGYSGGERGSGDTREHAADWLAARAFVASPEAAKHLPDDPYEGLPGA